MDRVKAFVSSSSRDFLFAFLTEWIIEEWISNLNEFFTKFKTKGGGGVFYENAK
jgi:hypothetical protein